MQSVALQKLRQFNGDVDEINDGDIDAALQPSAQSQDDWCCMYRVLSLQEDFRSEKSMLPSYIEERGHICEFLPKFHCELAAIMLWGFGKYRAFDSF